MQKHKVLAIPADNFACGNWRIIQPFSRMNSEYLLVEMYKGGLINLIENEVIVLQRPETEQMVKVIKKIRSYGRRVVLDFDDRFPIDDPQVPAYPYYHPGSQAATNMLACIRLADGLIVSTIELADHYRKYNPNVLVAPNAIDPNNPAYQKRPPKLSSAKTYMLWTGWDSHAKNLRIIKDAIDIAFKELPDLILLLCGPESMLEAVGGPNDRILYIKPLPFAEFRAVAALADFSLAPLELRPFNEFKSEIRILESAVWGVPTIASDVTPYRRFYSLSDGGCLLVKNETNEWVQAIKHLVANPDKRKCLGDKALAAIANYDLIDINSFRERFILGLLGEGIDDSAHWE